MLSRMLYLEIAIVALLMVVNAFFAMSELAVVSSRRIRLQALVREGHHGARAALRLLEDPTRFLSTVQVGITLIGIFAGAFSGAMLADPLAAWLSQWTFMAEHAETVAIAAIVIVITYLSLVVGELVPKRVALGHPERIAARVAPVMEKITWLAGPLATLLKISVDAILRPFNLHKRRDSSITEEDIRALIAEGTRAGVFVQKEREMIDAVLRLADRKVSALMTPRQDVVWLDERASHEEIAAELDRSRHSRLPVCRGTLDEPIGIVHAKDLLRTIIRGEQVSLAEAAVPPLVVPERLPAFRLLDLFRRERVHMALVVNEYGSTEGIVTHGDFLQSIAGGLPELGEQEPPGLFRRKDGTWLVDGGVRVDLFEDRLGVDGLREGGDFDTMAGFVLFRLGRIPSIGDTFDSTGGRFEVVDMDGRRVDTILFTPPAIPPPPDA